MQRRSSQRSTQKKQQKTVYKGIYISNQRRKGPGGRIKCDQFQCKIEVSDFNPAIHQSQIQWVQIRRYIRGQKRQGNNKDKGKDRQQDKNFKKDNNTNVSKNNKQKPNQVKQIKYGQKKQNKFQQKVVNKNQQTKQKSNNNESKQIKQQQISSTDGYTNLVKKFKQSKLKSTQLNVEPTTNQEVKQMVKQPQSQILAHKNQQKSHSTEKQKDVGGDTKSMTQSSNGKISQNQKTQKSEKISQCQASQSNYQDHNQEDIETQSDLEDQLKEQSEPAQQIIQQKKQIIILTKQKITSQQQKSHAKSDTQIDTAHVFNQHKEVAKSEIVEVQGQKKQIQQVIVGRIIKQTKIVYKQKRFVGILTCEKKKNSKAGFIQRDIKPIDKILQDYFLDVTPIHSRLPKMQLDNLVKQNIKVLNQYIQKIHPQKGKQLTKKVLNDILDIVQSIYVVASFNQWNGQRPYANIHQIIGKTMTIDGQCNCFLFEHHLNDFNYEDEKKETQKIGQNQNGEAKQQKQVKKIQLVPGQHHKKFEKMVFSIDPSTSIDLDDALSIQKLPSQNSQQQLYQIGIHISDVSQYLPFIKRQQLMKRTTSVYLPHKVFHMLTEQIMKISSLNPNVDRLAFSIYVKMNLKGQIVEQNSRIEKNIIKSRFKLSYQTVQDIITAKIGFQQFIIKHPNTSLEEFNTLVEKLQQLTKIGIAHRQKRIKFQVFENRQIHFQLDQNRWPIDISVQSRYTSKKIVQEYMIIGNVEAAKHLIKNFRNNALIIYHPKPNELSIKNFNDTFKFLDIKFQFDDIRDVQEQFLKIQNSQDISPEIKQFMYFKGRRVQQTAGYKLYHEAVSEILEKGDIKDQKLIKNVHFALGEDFYTHFTSPMRRMADILVHQTLNSLIYKTQPKTISVEDIQKINLGRKHTKRLKKDLTQIYMCLMIHKTGKKIQEDGIITSFGLKSVSIYIPYFDMMKEIIWRDQLDIHRVSKNRQNQQILDVCIYYDRNSPSRDIYWKVKKFDKVKLTIDCTKRPPLRLAISLEVTSTKGKKQIIDAYFPDF